MPAQAQVRGIEGTLDVPLPLREQIEEKVYIVQLEKAPTLNFHRANRDLRNQSADRLVNDFDPDLPENRRYTEGLQRQQDALLAKLQLNRKPIHNYRYTFNGFAVQMTEAQAEKIRQRKGVLGVWEDRLRYVSTANTPDFLEITDAENGLAAARGLTGENVIIGIIDSGIAADHPSFSDVSYGDINNGTGVTNEISNGEVKGLCGMSFLQDTLLGDWLCGSIWKRYTVTYETIPARWLGTCETGEGFDATQCNNKLIGARYYYQGFAAGNETDENEFLSPLDTDGHGTHIASIAAGNAVTADIAGTTLGTVQGIAPRARIAVYKACWLQPDAVRASCSISDLQRAIEDAVADGVDIINFSVGDENPSINDPDDLALLAAAEAGVLTVAAAGNAGPFPGSIDSPGTAPWVLTVGASTRAGTEFDTAITVTSPAPLADDYVAVEADFTPALNNYDSIIANLILADDGEEQTPEGDDGTTYDACDPLVNGANMSGNVALIVRGGCDFDIKIQNAENADAVAVLIYNDEAAPFIMDGDWNLVSVPALMLGQADGVLLRDELIGGGDIEVVLDAGIFIPFVVDGNEMGNFSARGENTANASILKPDLTAPGVNILAAQSPDVANSVPNEQFQYLTGTSMAAPHVTGVAALLKQAYPDWGPDRIKSALMTTARQNVVKEDGATAADPFDFGAGHVDANPSATPALIYPLQANDYDAFLCGTDNPRLSDKSCADLLAEGYSDKAYDLNLPSVALGQLAAVTTVKRRVTNIGEAGIFEAAISAPAGINISIQPNRLSLAANETAEFEITITNQSATNYEWRFGSYSWNGNGAGVRSPVAVRPVILQTPDVLRVDGPTGSSVLPVQFGYNGSYNPQTTGLEPACVLPDSNPDDAICTNSNSAFVTEDEFPYTLYSDPTPPSVQRFFIKIEDDQELLRVRLFNEFTDGNDDLDVYVYYCLDGTSCNIPNLRGDSKGETSDELVDIYRPASGTWVIDVHGFATESPAGTNFRLHTWSLERDNDAGNLIVDDAPSEVTFGSSADLELIWSDLPADIYLGGISHSSDIGIPPKERFTIIELDARPATIWTPQQ